MMTRIHILDEVTANQISAGEVVERPVNAVKELVENAVDSGASSIEIEIADGGMSYIRVTDDGSGMSREDAKLSIVRHATSKISNIESIYHIASLGFRGEALASMAAVSRMRITTRQSDDTEGTVVEVEGGDIKNIGSAGAPSGTTVELRELFFNVPARKKFLKSERSESGRINSMVGKLALANPNVAFRLINNGRTVIESPGNDRLKDAVAAIYGTKMTDEMFNVAGQGDNVFLDGMISKPSVLKSNRSYQTIIVNRRVVESPIIVKAVDHAYHSLLPRNGYPVMVLILTVPPDRIDVNVHPQKREIKFSEEQILFRLVYHSVLDALTSQSTPNAIAREMTRIPSHDVVSAEHNPMLGVRVEFPFENAGLSDNDMVKQPRAWGEAVLPYAVQDAHGKKPVKAYTPGDIKKELQSGQSLLDSYRKEQSSPAESALFHNEPFEEDPILPLGQVAKCFILCQHGDDLYIIDQHAAHERVRYDRLAERAEGIPVQDMLMPCLIHVDTEDIDLLEEKKDDIQRLGITFEQAGSDVIRVTGAPGDFSQADMERVIQDLLTAYYSDDVPSPETLRHRMMAYAACRGAIKRGDVINIRQMKELISDLFKTSRPFVCPHGRPTIVRFTPEELGHLFKRP